MDGSLAYRLAAGLALGTALGVAWIHGALATADDTPGILLLAAPGVGVVGALLARFRARGMAWALGAAAVAQAIVGNVAMARWGQYLEIGLLTLALTAAWTASALLFRRAASRRSAR